MKNKLKSTITSHLKSDIWYVYSNRIRDGIEVIVRKNQNAAQLDKITSNKNFIKWHLFKYTDV
jgi:hypothetical protein